MFGKIKPGVRLYQPGFWYHMALVISVKWHNTSYDTRLARLTLLTMKGRLVIDELMLTPQVWAA